MSAKWLPISLAGRHATRMSPRSARTPGGQCCEVREEGGKRPDSARPNTFGRLYFCKRVRAPSVFLKICMPFNHGDCSLETPLSFRSRLTKKYAMSQVYKWGCWKGPATESFSGMGCCAVDGPFVWKSLHGIAPSKGHIQGDAMQRSREPTINLTELRSVGGYSLALLQIKIDPHPPAKLCSSSMHSISWLPGFSHDSRDQAGSSWPGHDFVGVQVCGSCKGQIRVVVPVGTSNVR